MNVPLVSVIIPAFNCANFIRKAIESVLGQTYQNIELIIIDDGSKDNTAEVITHFEDKVIYVYQENGGVSKARNAGIRKSSGEYIAFLDADDVWEKSKLEVQIRIMEENINIGLLFCEFTQTKNQNILHRKTYESAFNIFKEYKYGINDMFDNISVVNMFGTNIKYYWGNIYKYLFLGNFILPSSVLFRRNMLDFVGYFNEEYRVAEETEYFLRFSRHTMLGFIKFPLLYYEIPESGNLSGKSNMEKLIRNALKIQIDSFINNCNSFSKKDISFFMKAISVTYCRLAYYYISELRLIEARKYAVYGIKAYKINYKLYCIYVISMLPRFILQKMANIKRCYDTSF